MLRPSLSGFALIELMIVIGIIGNIAGIVLVASDSVRERARMANLYSYSSGVEHQLLVECAGMWELDEGAGSTTADRCQNNSSNLINNPPTWTDGTNNTAAVDFNGSNEYIRANNVPSYNPSVGFTLEAFVYPHNLSGTEMIVSGGTGPTPLTYIARYNNTFRFRWLNNSIPPLAPTITGPTGLITTNRWYHVLGTHNGTTARLYVDGVLVATSGTSSLNATTPTTYDIGRYYNSTFSGYYFDGLIDAVHVYNEPHIQR